MYLLNFENIVPEVTGPLSGYKGSPRIKNTHVLPQYQLILKINEKSRERLCRMHIKLSQFYDLLLKSHQNPFLDLRLCKAAGDISRHFRVQHVRVTRCVLRPASSCVARENFSA